MGWSGAVHLFPQAGFLRIVCDEDGKERGVTVSLQVWFHALAELLRFTLSETVAEAKKK